MSSISQSMSSNNEVTCTTIEVKAPLQQRLYKSYNSSELKKPLLEDD